MALELLKERWSNSICAITIGSTKENGGTRTSAVTVGGESTLPFLLSEGAMPHRPVIAMEILDTVPEDWPPVLKEPFKDVFNDPIGVRNKIKIRGYDFKVIGIMEEIGNSQDDNAINIDTDTYRIIFDEPDKVDAMMVQAKPGQDMDALKTKVERRLKKARDDENYQVMTAAQIGEQINSILGIIQVVLVGIAAISLLVGSIGIMNSMYTSVLERTKEIGIMKSIGARNSDILKLFLIESAIIGFIGGIFGVLMGSGIAWLVGFIADQAGFGLLKVTMDWKVMLTGLLFAISLGMVSGLMPAKQASKLKPVDALRYE